jgi:hypothetical protein
MSKINSKEEAVFKLILKIKFHSPSQKLEHARK